MESQAIFTIFCSVDDELIPFRVADPNPHFIEQR